MTKTLLLSVVAFATAHVAMAQVVFVTPRPRPLPAPLVVPAPVAPAAVPVQAPFEVPPAEEWPHMVQTLRYIHDYVVPAVGPVEPVSVYRNPALNVCAGGAPESAHKLDSAVDMVPLRPIDRVTLMRTLCGVHSEHGAAYNAGLGFYAYLRFHVDSTKFRRWNMDPAVAAECPPIVHPEDVASVGQPLVAPAPGSASAPIGAISAPITPTSPPAPSTLPPRPSKIEQ